jgi:phosphoribosyl-ATP pyrophosphohydrolase
MDEILSTLEKILEQRKSATTDNSYVASLYNQGTDKILDKISEESAEVIKAAKEEGNDKIIHEVADLWFHTLVLLRHKNISIKEIETELIRRFGVSGHAEKAARTKSNEEKSS